MISRSRSLAWVTLCFMGCAGSAPAPQTPQERSPSTIASPVQPVTVGRKPSDKILSRWTPPDSVRGYLYADLGELFRTEQFKALVAAGVAMARSYTTPSIAQCVTEWSNAVQEVAFAAGDQGLLVATYDPSALKTPIDTCIQALGGPSRREIAGVELAYAVGDELLVIQADTIVFGTRPLVESGLSNGPRRGWPEDVTLEPGEQVVVVGADGAERLELRGTLSVTTDHFTAHADVTFSDEPSAKLAAEAVAPDQIKEKLFAASPGIEPLVGPLLEPWHVTRDGRRVTFEYRLEGDPKQAMAKLGMVAALATQGVRLYIAQAKAFEARIVVGRIAQSIAGAAPRRLVSLPPVPARFELVQGTKYQSTAADWAKWASVGFSMQEPQYYQYRVEAAKDGRSAEVIAEGDLDGNGKRSRFSFTVRRDPETRKLVVDPALTEQDSLE